MLKVEKQSTRKNFNCFSNYFLAFSIQDIGNGSLNDIFARSFAHRKVLLSLMLMLLLLLLL